MIKKNISLLLFFFFHDVCVNRRPPPTNEPEPELQLVVYELQLVDPNSRNNSAQLSFVKLLPIVSQGVTTPYVLRKGCIFFKKFDSSYNNFFSVWEH